MKPKSSSAGLAIPDFLPRSGSPESQNIAYIPTQTFRPLSDRLKVNLEYQTQSLLRTRDISPQKPENINLFQFVLQQTPLCTELGNSRFLV
jgi:hypothetical protein